MSGDVRGFYRGKNVLLTGGTGFLGKIIVEKLLRTCEVRGIYLIIRKKEGLTSEERLRKLVEEPVFEKMRETNANFISNIHIIEGDLSKKRLDLTTENIELIRNNINIVFHCGASLNMDSKLGDSVITNVRGTAEILDIVKEAKNLQSFVQVSTAYSYCCQRLIEETFYEPPLNPDLLIQMTEELKPNILESISPGLIGTWPNSYVYSKAIAENLLLIKGKNLPVGLFRPAIVTSTASEPIEGWVDNLYGPLGILLSTHCGILRVVRANGDVKSHTVPGDMCVNALLCLAWEIDRRWRISSENYQPPILNFSGKDTKLLMPIKEYTDFSKLKYTPFKKAMWYQMLFLVKTEYHYLVLKFLLHNVPAYVIDWMLMLLKKRPKMKKLYAKLERVSDVLCYFLINEWDIDNKNVLKLWDKLDETDKKLFNFDIDSIDIEKYFINQLNGLKKYVLKEDMSKSSLHNQRYKRLTLLHYSTKYLFIGFAAYPICKTLYKFLKKRK